MSGFPAAAQRHEPSVFSGFRAASARSENLELTGWARSQVSLRVDAVTASPGRMASQVHLGPALLVGRTAVYQSSEGGHGYSNT